MVPHGSMRGPMTTVQWSDGRSNGEEIEVRCCQEGFRKTGKRKTQESFEGCEAGQGCAGRIADAARSDALWRQPLRRGRLGFRPRHHRSVAEVAFLVCEALHLHPDQFEMFANARVTSHEAAKILALIDRRIATRKPAAYLVNKIYMRGLPFYVDERVIVPRSFIGELLDSHFGGMIEEEGGSLIDDPGNVERGAGSVHRFWMPRDPCVVRAFPTPPSMRWIFRAMRWRWPRAMSPTTGSRIASRCIRAICSKPSATSVTISSLPIRLMSMRMVWRDCRASACTNRRSRSTAATTASTSCAGSLDSAKDHLTPDGGLLCEIGRGRNLLDEAYPNLPLLWLDTEDSDGEVYLVCRRKRCSLPPPRR